MLNADEIERIKKYIGPDGKLIIDESLTEAEKQNFEYINSLDVDLLKVINKDRNKTKKSFVDEDLDEEDESDDFDDISYDSSSLEDSAEISENENVSVNDLEDLF